MSGEDRCLKEAGPRSVWRRREAAGTMVVKTWPLSPLMGVKLLLGIGQPQRQRRGARRTRDAGIRTPDVRRGPRPVRRGGRLLVELAHDYVPGRDALQVARARANAAGGGPGDLNVDDRAIGRACGDIVARYARAGLLHRDLKLSNVVVADDGGLWVVDTVGVRRHGGAAAAVARMLERLDVQLGEHRLEVGAAPRRAALAAGLGGLTREQRREAARRLRAHRRR